VSLFAVLMSGGGVLLGPVMLADFVVVRRLMVMMGSRGVASRCIMMVLGRRMFALVGHKSFSWLDSKWDTLPLLNVNTHSAPRPISQQASCR
jgi:hypothetical protein